MDFSLSEEQQLLKKPVRDFAESELRPHAREWDERQEFPREVFTKLGEMGLMDETAYPAHVIASEDCELVFIPREAAIDLEIGGHRVPKGTLVLWSAHLAGHDPAQPPRWPVPFAPLGETWSAAGRTAT